MVVMPKQNVPALRLEGFSGEWEETTLGELGSTYGGLSGKKKEDFGHGDAMYVTYKDIFSRALITDTSQCERVEVDASQNEVRYGDIFFTTSSEIPEEVGLSAVWLIDKPNVYLNSFCFGFRPTGGFDLHFLGHVLRSPAVRSQFLLLAQGISRFNISKTKAANISLYAPPTLEEQQAIGAVFTNLDAAINQHTLKHKALQQSKTALMQRMFPQEGLTAPELRLEGFDGEWEEKRLVDEVSFFSGLTYTPSDVVEHDGTLVLRSSNVQDGVIATKDCVYVRTDAVNVQNVRKNDIIMVVRNGSRSLIGKHAVVQKPMPSTVIGAFMTGIRSDQPWFINALFDTGLFKYEVDKSMGATINQITGGMFAGMSFFFPPTLEEQQAIGAIFTKLDALIAAEAQYIKSLSQAKTALLQRMFI